MMDDTALVRALLQGMFANALLRGIDPVNAVTEPGFSPQVQAALAKSADLADHILETATASENTCHPLL